MFLRLYFVILVFVAGLCLKAVVICIPTLNGRYTKDIANFKLAVPFRATADGQFSSFVIPNFYKQKFEWKRRRRRRSLDDPELVHYAIHLNDGKYHAELWPNHGLVSPNAVLENRRVRAKVQDRKLQKIDEERMCHYTGRLRGEPGSKVALSTCEGLAGYITVGSRRYFIEPVEEHVANSRGQHLHVIYEKSPTGDGNHGNKCGTSGNWRDAWKKRFYEKFKYGSDVEKRGSESVHRYLETLIVCDKKFLEYHKHRDYETYILTVMNMVSDYYHDASGGNQMDVVVVRIMYLDKEEEEIDLMISQNAEDTLASFCKWQQKINPKELSNPNHHDIAVLLTRYDICADNLSNCGLMGLAYVASACTGNEPCAINEDSGLVLSVVVAHEMGHVMGCAHDKEGESDCPAQDKDESYFVMAPSVHLFTTRWSTCSKGFMTALFENGLGECLNDEPDTSIYKTRQVLPGVVYGADEQCGMLVPNSKLCSFGEENFCQVLLCESAPDKCVSKGEPPADGTKCGENMWCYRKECVEIGERPEAVNGGWGEWTGFTECSRTCGGGVQISSRECDNPAPEHKGRYCLGDRKKVKICNIDPCPPGSPSFRETQCIEHNSKPFQGKLHQWKAYFKPDEPCVLYCLSNENVFAKLEPRAKDGTKCKPGTKYMCISGSCKKVGCDGEIDSDAVEDLCGVCNGDGTQCKIIEKIYQDRPGVGYVKVTTIPAGSRNVFIEEEAPSMNTIAISDQTEKKFYLNGGFKEQRDGDKPFGEQVQGLYSHPERDRETLVIHGPLTEDLVFFVAFYRPENVGYRYKYAEASMDVSYTPKYHWEQTEWDDCSVKCGGGFQNSKYTCIEEKAGKVSTNFCESSEKPEMLTQSCNERPCKTKWKMGKWGKCHACKFKSGVRMREVECVMESPHPGTDDILVEDKECNDAKPGTRELCNSHMKCKSRRYTDGLPDEMMEDVWHQIRYAGEGTDKGGQTEDKINYKGSLDKNACQNGDGSKSESKLNVGKIVKDHIPPEEIKVIEVPFKQSHLSLDLSDAAFETMGDKVGDSLDTDKAKIATGEGAANILKNMQHEHQ